MIVDPARPIVRRGPWLARIALASFTAAVMAAAVACGDGGERFPALSNIDMGGGHPGRPSIPQACTDGDTRECKVVLGVQGSVVSCFYGVQECADGGWGDCVDPTVVEPP